MTLVLHVSSGKQPGVIEELGGCGLGRNISSLVCLEAAASSYVPMLLAPAAGSIPRYVSDFVSVLSNRKGYLCEALESAWYSSACLWNDIAKQKKENER